MDEGATDFGIITALKVERQAVVRRLDDRKKIQDDHDPATYYTGLVNILGSDDRYEVVVVELEDMGNDEAAAATTRLIHRWHPQMVLMVGVAGGRRQDRSRGRCCRRVLLLLRAGKGRDGGFAASPEAIPLRPTAL